MYLMKLARASAPDAKALAELSRFLAIPSVSADPAHGEDVTAAAHWVADYAAAAGGRAEGVDWSGSRRVAALAPASGGAEGAPTILCYGHVDVQPPAPLELWETDPFDATLS